jgi:hypothetical protein
MDWRMVELKGIILREVLHVGQAASFLDSELANYRDLTGGAPCSPA